MFLRCRLPVLVVVILLMVAENVRPGRADLFSHEARSRGSFAVHYEPTLSEEDLQWYSHFDILVTHDPLPRDQVDRLHAAGTKLVLYEWSVAFYESRATEWQRSLLRNKRSLLNYTPLTGGVGSNSSGASYFDPATVEHQFGRAADLRRRIEAVGYDGVFFDTTTAVSVHPQARRTYEQRHPETHYDEAFARFLLQLRQSLPNAILITNQGYRNAPYYLPYVDWDLTESLITSPDQTGLGSQQIRPWTDSADPWNSIEFVMRTDIEPVAARYPHVRFGHLNYINAIDRSSAESIRLVVAISEIFGADGYVQIPAMFGDLGRIYFRNPGKPISKRFDRADGKVMYRYFENGVIAITSAAEEVKIENVEGRALRNHVSGELTCGVAIKLPGSSGTPRAYFFDYDFSSACRG